MIIVFTVGYEDDCSIKIKSEIIRIQIQQKMDPEIKELKELVKDFKNDYILEEEEEEGLSYYTMLIMKVLDRYKYHYDLEDINDKEMANNKRIIDKFKPLFNGIHVSIYKDGKHEYGSCINNTQLKMRKSHCVDNTIMDVIYDVLLEINEKRLDRFKNFRYIEIDNDKIVNFNISIFDNDELFDKKRTNKKHIIKHMKNLLLKKVDTSLIDMFDENCLYDIFKTYKNQVMVW